jgi:hypothetical protein
MKQIHIGALFFVIIGFMAVSVDAEYITGYYKDAFFQGSSFDHTYACVSPIGCYSIVGPNGYPSTTYGGAAATATIYVSHQNAIFVACAGNGYMYYGLNGVCHQHTNRILYYANTSLPYWIRGYSASKVLYGTYGECGPTNGRFSTCLTTCGNRQ